MPSSFPEVDFRAFGIVAAQFFPDLLSDEVLYDPLERQRHFDWSWQAVRCRYRSCAECSEEFKVLLDNASQAFVSGMGDEELTYKLERCIYVFFIGGLSVFDSFALCLYFLGNAISFPRGGQSTQDHPCGHMQSPEGRVPARRHHGPAGRSATGRAVCEH